MMLLGNINAIPFRRRFGGGGGTPFPYIPGMIARYSGAGLTNEDMSTNPVWKDLTGNGHDLQMKSFAWGEMSGVNGYVQNFNYFRNNATVDKVRIDEQSSNSIKVTILTTGINNAIFIPKNTYQFNKSYFIKISSEGYNEGDLFLSFYAPSTSTATTVKVPLNPNGITEIPAIKEDDFLVVYIAVGGKVGSITIEQLPLYPGALVFDGVDDYGICENFPILTKEKGYTVVVLRQWITTPNDNLFYGLMTNGNNRTDGAFVFEDFNRGSKSLFNFGGYTTVESGTLSMPFTYQTSTSYNGKAINIGSLEKGVDIFYVGRMGRRSYYVNAAVWEICILDHDATEEELQKIQDYYKQEYPWLFPDQAWTVTGKTNEDTDRATIANITGNGNNLVLSNFGFAEGSGYGLYAYNFNSFDLRDNVVKPTDVKKDSFRIIGTGNSGNVLVLSNTSNSAAWKIRITGMKEGDSCIVGNANKSGDYIKIIKDGIYTFQKQYAATSTNGIWYNSSQEVDVLVEQIPEYEGYLVTDGMDDGITSSSFQIGDNWTIVGEWKWIKETDSYKLAGILKSNAFILYNYSVFNQTNVYVKSLSGKSVYGDTVKALLSNGDCYVDFNNLSKISVGDKNDSGYTLNIAKNNVNYTKMAFKNLAIYPTVLSKEDCIKSYIYLQTLKSK